MTLEELENTPPHDAEVQRSAVDYEHRKVTFALAVWVGHMDDPPERREAYKSGCLEITGLLSRDGASRCAICISHFIEIEDRWSVCG